MPGRRRSSSASTPISDGRLSPFPTLTVILRSLRTALVAALLAGPALAQTSLPPPPPLPADWHLRDADADGVPGISLDRAYALLDGRTPARDVVVAIIDSGVDLTHPDLVPVLWTNPGETAGNGVDDDGNGYVDDVHGWSFLGGPGGNVEHERLERTRLVARCRMDTAPDGTDCDALDAALTEERQQLATQAAQMGPIFQQVREAHALLTARFGPDYRLSGVDAAGDADVQRARQVVAFVSAQGATPSDLAEFETYLTGQLQYNLNPDYDPRGMVGDDPDDVTERDYGVPDAAGPDPSHGTGVAGLVAAVRGNGLGIDGIAPARIMSVRAVPDGDERDKDVANAIRYAVDNGAQIINMSFGKSLSPEKSAVDEAVAYAVARGVLLVHASGNDGKDLDAPDSFNFPMRVYDDGGEAETWLEIGASAADAATLAAPFSNYGATRVDLFAPGAAVTSLAPGGGVATHDGTSFAAPVTTGVAALLMAYFPDLTATDVRQILMDSATRYADTATTRPGAEDATTFGALSVSGGVVNAARAVELALERTR